MVATLNEAKEPKTAKFPKRRKTSSKTSKKTRKPAAKKPIRKSKK